ncbi:MAG TPA: pyrroline-5-carboxylate reductase [Nitrospiraceae bacterium]|nr:MAG: pyrroline-5-carboxylate reductase [Nitrospirae bacterium GWA2_46_11]OGW24822.1 MAG: pyrroline-5-carboxylate reductase [Nitrospirae bacterium GWB2_47_37]HAK89273.1 pyrroline-5-carboxylate reductase [Nitrospiraceae bacterium]HCZ11969.1 pyrroline-5-carboxylate reductase [Nitrospiraceae bacterium]
MIGFIGGGNMAEALIKGMTSQGMKDIIVSEPREERRKYLEQTYGIKATPDNKGVANLCNIIILAVKPQNMDAVLDEITVMVTDDKTVVSIAAGITLSYLQSKLKTKKLIRVMPNTPALVQEGMSVMSLCECFSDRDISIVRDIFMSVGRVLTMPEKYMNAVTALSGSGPAFIALFVEALIEGGVKTGINKEHAVELAVQTLLGTAKLLDTGMAPERLREMVTSPGGTTAAGLKVFEEKYFKDITVDALHAAVRRAEELGRRE